MTRYSYLVVADDLTGANDTGYQFATAGFDTVVRPSHSSQRPDADVLVVDTDSRTSTPRAAVADVRSVIATASAQVYKKVDSTLRGNLCPEVDAALAASPASVALVAPAFPTSGRTTVGGYHLVDGVPVSEAATVQQRENPPATADLLELFAESAHSVTHVSIETVARGPVALTKRLRSLQQSDEHIVLCDVATDDHLRTVASAGHELTESPLFVGSAGLAGALWSPDTAGCADGHERTLQSDRVLGVIGSPNRRTFEQLRQVPEGLIATVDVERAITEPATAGDALAAVAGTRLQQNRVVVITAAESPADVTAALDYGRAHGIETEAVQSAITTALATATDSLWSDHSPDAVLASGGTVAGAVFETLGIDAIELGATAVEQTVPIATATERDDRRIALATKAGGFGRDDAIVNCLSALGADI